MADPWADFIPKAAVTADPWADFVKPAQSPAAPSSGPVEASMDIARMMIKGAAGGKEATPEDAADRANALRQSIGRKVLRGRMPAAAPVTPDQYRPFFEEQQREQAAAERRAGPAALAAEIGGAILAGGPLSRGVSMAGGAARGLPVMGSVLNSPWTGAAATGAILGASGAQGTDQNKLLAAALGAGAGLAGQAVGNAISGGVNKVAGSFNKAPAIPTREGIEAAKNAAYASADRAGVVYTPEMFKRVEKEAIEELTNLGYSPKLQPKIAAVLEELNKAGQGNVTLKGAEVLRKIAGNAYDAGNKSSNHMMGLLKSKIDDAMGAPKAGEVLMGDAAAGIRALQEGRRTAQIGFKMDDIAKAMEMAKLQTAASGSGGNIDNNMRRKIAQALLAPGKGRGLTPDERAAAELVVNGSTGQNLARLLGKLSPSGNGLMAALHGGSAVYSGGATLPLAGLGMGAKATADRMTQANIKQLERVILAGGSSAATKAPDNAIQRLAKAERERLARILAIAGAVSLPALAQ